MIARKAALTLAMLLSVGTLAAPADAQRRRVVEVFGNDKCPDGVGGEIVVCAKRPESDRYRIPTEFREATQADSVSQSDRVQEMVDIGRTGTDSCSPVGPGGFTGCFQQQVRNNRAEKRAVARAREEEPQ